MKIIEKNYNVQTGEEIVTERDETAQEQAERESLQEAAKAKHVEAEAKALARQGILDRLGLTGDELKLLLG